MQASVCNVKPLICLIRNVAICVAIHDMYTVYIYQNLIPFSEIFHKLYVCRRYTEQLHQGDWTIITFSKI